MTVAYGLVRIADIIASNVDGSAIETSEARINGSDCYGSQVGTTR